MSEKCGHYIEKDSAIEIYGKVPKKEMKDVLVLLHFLNFI